MFELFIVKITRLVDRLVIAHLAQWNVHKQVFANSKSERCVLFTRYLIISENKKFKVDRTEFDKVNFALLTPKEFTQFKLKKDRKTDSYLIPEVSAKYDLIIIDKCNTIGGNTLLTSALKILVKQSVTKKGFVAMKSYFDPVLEKNKSLFLI